MPSLHREFVSLIHAFSLLDFHAERGRSGPGYAAARYENKSTIPKHLKLLNSLALLLINEPKSEVAATSFDVTPTSGIFHWARNGNEASAIEVAYIDKLLGMAKASAQDRDMLARTHNSSIRRKVVDRNSMRSIR